MVKKLTPENIAAIVAQGRAIQAIENLMAEVERLKRENRTLRNAGVVELGRAERLQAALDDIAELPIHNAHIVGPGPGIEAQKRRVILADELDQIIKAAESGGKCDGNHPMPPCGDKECWHSSGSV